MGSVGIAGSIAKLAFVTLVVWGYLARQPRRSTLAVFAVIGAAMWILLPRIDNGYLFVTPALAVVDIALVFLVAKGDVTIG
jgi:hypothetical protein